MSISQNFPSEGPNLNLNFTHSRILDSRVSFTRTSSATLVNENGMVATVAAGIPRFDHRVTITENLILYSEQFNVSASWGATNVTVTANQAVAPDGSTTADLITASLTGNDRLLGQFVTVPASNLTYTGSIYVKRSTYRYFSFGLFFNGGTTQESVTVIDLEAGTISNSTAAPTSLPTSNLSITPLSDGWYRISIRQTNNGTNTSIRMSLRPLNHNSPENTVASNALIWGAQLEVGSTATTYIPTTNVKVESIDVESMGILVEEQRTNLLTYSDDFSNAAWSKTNVSVTANSTASLAPDGTFTADEIVPTTAGSQLRPITQSYTISTAQSYTFSVFVKKHNLNSNFIGIRISNNTATADTFINFDFSTEAFSTVPQTTAGWTSSASVEKFPNGWYRLSITANTVATTHTILQVNVWGGGYQGTTETIGNYLIWGAQFEVGNFATSYIPTSASTVTRTPDIYSISGTNYSKWFNPLEGSIVVECENTGTKSNNFSTPFGLRSTLASSDPTIEVFQNNGSFYYLVRVAFPNDTVGIDVPLSLASQVGRYIRYGHTYKLDDFSYRINGTLYTDTSGTLPTGLIIAAIGSNNATYMNGRIKQISYYPYRLSNQFLTSLVP